MKKYVIWSFSSYTAGTIYLNVLIHIFFTSSDTIFRFKHCRIKIIFERAQKGTKFWKENFNLVLTSLSQGYVGQVGSQLNNLGVVAACVGIGVVDVVLVVITVVANKVLSLYNTRSP